MMTEFTNKELAEAFRLQIESGEVEQHNRTYLGMSQMGHFCGRHLWYYFRWARKQKHTPKKLRIFSRGNHEEPRITKMLEDHGLTITESQAPMEDCEAHLRGHIDSKLLGFPELEEQKLLGEFKTGNDKSFTKMRANGVMSANRAYWCQLQLYMHYQELTKALFIMVNKNTEELYFELVDIDPKAVTQLQSRAVDIITSPIPLPRGSDYEAYYECNWCDHKGICWGNDNMDRNCRTCKYSKPADQGVWECELHHMILTVDKQKEGCESYDQIKS